MEFDSYFQLSAQKREEKKHESKPKAKLQYLVVFCTCCKIIFVLVFCKFLYLTFSIISGKKQEFCLVYSTEKIMLKFNIIVGTFLLHLVAATTNYDIWAGTGGLKRFQPSVITIYTGDTVTFRWASGNHSVTADDGTWEGIIKKKVTNSRNYSTKQEYTNITPKIGVGKEDLVCLRNNCNYYSCYKRNNQAGRTKPIIF